MRHIIILLISSFFIVQEASGQFEHLVPLDSSNYVYIRDSLIDIYKSIPDTNFSFALQLKKIKQCPCSVKNVKGIISFKSYSLFIKSNACYFIYQSDNGYKIRVGHMTKIKDESGNLKWKFKTVRMKEIQMNELILNVKIAVAGAKVRRFNSWKNMPIVYDAVGYLFEDIEKQKFAETFSGYCSESLLPLIKNSKKLALKK